MYNEQAIFELNFVYCLKMKSRTKPLHYRAIKTNLFMAGLLQGQVSTETKGNYDVYRIKTVHFQIFTDVLM